MAFDYSNPLDNATNVNNDFDIVNRAGTVSTIQVPNTAGEWCTEVSSTTSSGTGASSTPTGASGFIYIETSSPVASTTWELRRKIAFDGSLNNIFLDFQLNRLCDTGSTFYVEYTEEVTPTTWIIKGSYAGLTTEAWEPITLDFSALNSTTVWIRFRIDSLNAYTNDFCVATWREYGTNKNTIIGSTTDTDTALNEVNESAPNGEVVGVTAQAIDVDAGDTVTYSLTDDAVGRFAIDSVTGVVSVADTSTIVYNTNTSHSITIRATSSDTSFTELTVTINVISDAPVSVSAITDTNSSNNLINEICVIGDLVNVTALATDNNYADTVSYSLTDDAGGRFQVDSTTGVITVLDPTLIVYDNATVHSITVLATSTDGSTSTKDFIIDVEKEILPALLPTTKFNTIRTLGVVNVGIGILINDTIFDCDVYINEAIDISNSTFKKNVYITTGLASTITFSNVFVEGQIFNLDTLNPLTINLLQGGSAIANNAGSGNAQVLIQSIVTIDINVQDQSGTNLENALVYIDDDLNIVGNVFNGLTNVTGNISTIYSGLQTIATIRIRKYGFKPYSGIINVSNDSSASITMVVDPQQVV